MPAPNSYRAKTCSFAASAKLGLQSIRMGKSGQASDLVTDAVDAVTAIFVDALAVDVTAVVSALDGVNTINPGDVGALVVTYEKRAEGRAAAGSGNLIATMANAVCQAVDFDAGTTGVGTATVTWRCSAPSGGSAIAWS